MIRKRLWLRAHPRLERLEARENPNAAYALSGSNLIFFDTASPAITSQIPVTGIAGSETLVGIDFRPQNGLLYGLGVNASADTGTLYAISTRTGVASIVGSSAGTIALTAVDLPDPATTGYGFDFNPAADRIRVVTGTGLNFRINPNTGAVVDGDGNPANGNDPDGNINTGATGVDAAAYTNNQPNNGGVTTLYTLDSTSNSLLIQNPPNNGTQIPISLVTLGANPLDFTGVGGFDIPAGVNAPASNAQVTAGSGFAVLNVGGTTSLYGIDLVSGQATFVGNVGNGSTAVQGLAIDTNPGGFPAIALNSAGDTLVRFNTGSPGTTTSQPINTASLVSGEMLAGIDFRPATGQLYALGIDATAETGSLYLVDPQTGGLTVVAASAIGFAATDFPDPAANGYGFDFNPDVDRIRVVTSTGLNFRINPITGQEVDADTVAAGSQPDGAINVGSTGLVGAAYTNSFGNDVAVTATTLYTIDSATDTLFIQNPPNNGAQTNPLPITLGGNPLDFTAVNGFDIPAGVRVGTSNAAAAFGSAFAALTVGGTTRLYSISLVTGAATDLGTVGTGTTTLTGLALADFASPLTTPTVTGASTNEDTQTTSGLQITESGATHFKILFASGAYYLPDGTTPIPSGSFVTSAEAAAGLKFTPDPDFFGTATFTVQGALAANDLALGGIAVTGTINVLPQADTPTVTDSQTDLNAQSTIGLVISRNAADSTEVTHFKITGITSGTLYLNDGTTPVADGSFITFAQGNAGLKFTPANGFLGTGAFTVQASTSSVDAGLSGGTVAASILVNSTPTATAIGGPNGGTITVKNADGSTRFSFSPFPGYLGSAGVSTADVNGDGIRDLLVFNPSASASHVKVFDGVSGAEIRSFYAFDPNFTGGASAAGSDVTGDGFDDIIVGAGPGGGPHVKVFDGATGAEIRSFYAYDPSYTGGVNVAGGDVDGDGRDDIITGAAATASHVKVFSGIDNSELHSFFAFPGYLGGVNVGVSHIGGFDRIVAGIGDAPRGTFAPTGTVTFFIDGAAQASVNPFPGFLGSVRVAGNEDGEIVAGAGPGAGPHVKVFDGATFTQLESFFAADPSFTGGVFVG